jgi:hypothetical protein
MKAYLNLASTRSFAVRLAVLRFFVMERPQKLKMFR